MSTRLVDERRSALAGEIATLVARGRRIESHDAFRAVLVRGHVLERRELVRVDEFGRVSREVLPLDRERLVLVIGIAILMAAFLIYVLITGI